MAVVISLVASFGFGFALGSYIAWKSARDNYEFAQYMRESIASSRPCPGGTAYFHRGCGRPTSERSLH